MIGTVTPNIFSVSTIFGTASAAASVFTVTRTSSEPAFARAITWLTVEVTSAVSVLVIDWTTMGWPPPTRTPPTLTATEARRLISAINRYFISGFSEITSTGFRFDRIPKDADAFELHLDRIARPHLLRVARCARVDHVAGVQGDETADETDGLR